MVYQEDSRIILMLNPEIEKNKERCAKYWPNLDDTMNVGHFVIGNMKETETPEFTLRELSLSNKNEMNADDNHPADSAYSRSITPRTIYQYQYVAWPETGYPENQSSVLGILHDINLKQTKDCPETGALVVHCSNGVGRTASIIVIDMLVKQLETCANKGLDSSIDIQRTVQHIRTQRGDQMVQLEAQYKFIYLAISHHVEMAQMEQISWPAHEITISAATTSGAVLKSRKTDPPPPPRPARQPPPPRESNLLDNKPPALPPPMSHRNHAKPPMIAINGTVPPPVPQRKQGAEQQSSMASVFTKPSHAEDLPVPNTPPPVPDRKK